jgi:hypothetical protein
LQSCSFGLAMGSVDVAVAVAVVGR